MNSYAGKINGSKQVHISTKLLRVIIGSKYKKTNSNKVVKNHCQHLTETQCN